MSHLLRHGKARTSVTLLLAGLVLGACNTSGLWFTDLVRPDAHGLYTYAVSRGDVRVVVLNNPFSVSKQELGSAIVDALEGVPPGGPRGTYATNPRPGSKTAIRFVFAFDTPKSQSAYDLCREDFTPAAAPAQANLHTLIAFCDGGTLQSWGSGQITRPVTPRDKGFQSMIGNGAWNLIPRPDPTIDGDCSDAC